MFVRRFGQGVVAACVAVIAIVSDSWAGESCAPGWDPVVGASGLSSSGIASAFAVFDDGTGSALYASAGSSNDYIAKWDGSQWLPLGSGLNNSVYALAVYNDELIAAGLFSEAGGVPADRVARWNGTSWSPLDRGLGGDANDEVTALIVYNGELIAGGDFPGGVVRWDGASWQPMGALDWTPRALEIYDGDLVAGHNAGVSRWDGSSWQLMGSVFSNGVWALTIYQGDLVAGGNFTSPGNRVARWDGSSWSTIGGGIGDGLVSALTVYENELIAGGNFDDFAFSCGTPFLFPGRNLAFWDGSSWQLFEGGIEDGPVRGLIVHNGDLIVGGQIEGAWHSDCELVSSANIAAWRNCPPNAPADINGDGVVDGLDLGILLANWSIPAGSPGCGGAMPCAADLNGDGVVDGLDLGMLLANWTL